MASRQAHPALAIMAMEPEWLPLTAMSSAAMESENTQAQLSAQ